MENVGHLKTIKLLETRGGVPTNKHSYEHVIASELKQTEVRTCDRCQDWRMRKLTLYIIIENSLQRDDREHLQLRHE